jgi:hypothetical protein
MNSRKPVYLLVILATSILSAAPLAWAQDNAPAQRYQSPYTFKNDISFGALYLRGKSGPNLDDTNYAGWALSTAHYFTPIFAMSADVQGVYGHAPVPSSTGLSDNPFVSQYAYFVGPQIRWRRRPRYSSSARVLVGAATSIFDSDTLGQSPTKFGLYPNETKLAIKVGTNFDLNLSPRVALRIASGTLFERYNGGFDHEFSIGTGLVYRIGKGASR